MILKSAESPGSERGKTALEILEERYARGEISEEEYEQKREKLKS
ncbi:MAG: SHOCT domain-containing protein [Candidatus Hadarchaeia archaeon]